MKRIVFFICCLLLFFNSQSQDLRNDSLDIIHNSLHLDFTSFSARVLNARADIFVQIKAPQLSSIRFDLEGLSIDSVKWKNQSCNFIASPLNFNILFPTILSINDTGTLQVWYHGQPIQNSGDFGGFYWNNNYAFNIGVSFLSTPHNYGRVWFPCFDNFVERSFYDFYVKTLPQHKAFCNGTLMSQNTDGLNKIWHWKMNNTIPSYLASVAVSAYTTNHQSYSGINGNIPIQLAASVSDSLTLAGSFINLQNALSIYENRFGPYLWERVGYCVVPFSAGAMEHATNISYMQGVVNGNTSYETLMAHELSHHWFGDLVTCDKAEEMWLNEGWAVYCEHVFLEGLYGLNSYSNAVRLNHEEVLHFAHIEDSNYHSLNNVPIAFTYGPTVYKKGADVAHSLRTYMGDTLFFNCIKGYLAQYSYQDVNSVKLRDYLQQCAPSKDVNQFFADWVFQPGFAHFSFDKIVKNLSSISFSIKQRLNNADHLYNKVPLVISVFDSMSNRFDFNVLWESNDSCASFELPLSPDFSPAMMAIDFNEQISDAITDEWKKITSSGSYNFGTAKVILNVTSVFDTAFVRVEHNWVSPDNFKNPIPGLHLSDYRYWKIDGILNSVFNSSIRFDYNGSTNSSGYLDNTFITNSEDSLVLLYRSDPSSDWSFADSFTVFKQGSATNKIGYILCHNFKKGEYAMAIWDHLRTNLPAYNYSGCQIVPISEKKDYDFSIFPNPVGQFVDVFVDLEGDKKFEVYSLEGKLQFTATFSGTTARFNLKFLPKGTYLGFLYNNNKRYTKTFIKQ